MLFHCFCHFWTSSRCLSKQNCPENPEKHVSGRKRTRVRFFWKNLWYSGVKENSHRLFSRTIFVSRWFFSAFLVFRAIGIFILQIIGYTDLKCIRRFYLKRRLLTKKPLLRSCTITIKVYIQHVQRQKTLHNGVRDCVFSYAPPIHGLRDLRVRE